MIQAIAPGKDDTSEGAGNCVKTKGNRDRKRLTVGSIPVKYRKRAGIR